MFHLTGILSATSCLSQSQINQSINFGYPLCPWNVMVFLSTRVIFMMLLLFDMVGLLRIFLQRVPMVDPTALSMLSVVQMELSLPSATMTSRIQLLS